TSVEDEPRSGRPKSATTPEIIEQVYDIVCKDPSLTKREIADTGWLKSFESKNERMCIF
ncbi:unnamed protein product, partial [Rotaria sp. Silwood1]